MAKKLSEMDKLKLDYARSYIAHIDGLDKAKADAEMAIEVIRAMAMPGAVRYDAINVTTSPNDDAIPNAVEALQDVSDLEYLVEQIEEERESFLLILRWEMKGNFGAQSMWVHYVSGADYKDIARSAGIDPTTERARRDEALIEMYDRGFIPQEYMIPNHQAV